MEFYILVVLAGKDVLQIVGKLRLPLKREEDLRLENSIDELLTLEFE